MHEGRFDGAHIGFVFTLIKSDPEEQVVMVAQSNDGAKYTTTVLAKPIKVSYFSVVNVFPPGQYTEVYTARKTRIDADSAVIEAIEASVTLFYFKGGTMELPPNFGLKVN